MAGPLQSVVIRAPATQGLNLEGEALEGNPRFARKATNHVYDSSGRIAARKGITKLTTTALTGTPDIEQVFMYQHSGGDIPIVAATVSTVKQLYDASTVSTTYDTLTSKIGALTPTGNNWQFVNFDDKCIGVQAGNSMIVKTTTGNWAAATATTGDVPTGNCVASAFGRLWVQKGNTGTNKGVINYSALLDHTHIGESSTGGGFLDPGKWAGISGHGYGEITAIQPFDDKLVVFFDNQIIVYGSPQVPNDMFIETVISGVGCLYRDSVQQVGDDLIFFDRTGLRSLRRSVEDGNFPMRDLSHRVRSELIATAAAATAGTVRSVFDPEEGFYILKAGSVAWCFDFSTLLEDQTPKVTKWDVPTWTAWYYHEGETYLGAKGYLGKYAGYTDNGSTYVCEWRSVWSDLDVSTLKILKKYDAVVIGAGSQSFTLLWSWDFVPSEFTATKTIPGGTTLAEWTATAGGSEWGIAEWGATAFDLTKLKHNASGFGETISFGTSVVINGQAFSIEQLSMYFKSGREAR